MTCCVPPLLLLRSFTFPFFLLCLLTLCCCHSAYLLFRTSSLLSCTLLMTVWYLSCVPSVPWYALLCHCCCPVSLSLFLLLLLLLLHPGSQPTLTYVSASDVLIHNRTMLIPMLNSSPTFLVTPRGPPERPHLLPQTYLSLHPTLPMAGLPGTGLLHAGRDCGLTCESPGETSRVSVHFTVLCTGERSSQRWGEVFPSPILSRRQIEQIQLCKHEFPDIIR